MYDLRPRAGEDSSATAIGLNKVKLGEFLETDRSRDAENQLSAKYILSCIFWNAELHYLVRKPPTRQPAKSYPRKQQRELAYIHILVFLLEFLVYLYFRWCWMRNWETK
jgi:hypothetical protein